ncbi:MAG: class I SAM-dependent methyltransferase [Thermocladium sp.]
MVYDVPFVPTPEVVVKRMLQLANVKPGEVLFDLGCGDGRIIITAARDFGARAYGVEIRKDLYEQCVRRIKELGLEDRVTVINGNFFEVPVSEADVVTMYLLTSVNERLKPKLEKELRPATRVVSHDFEMIGWKPIIAEDLYEEWRSHKIYLYKIPGAEIPVPARPLSDVGEKYRELAKLIDGNNSIEEIASKLNTTPRNVRSMILDLQKQGYISEIKIIK